MLLTLAWRNIWRNKKRSLIIISAIAVGLCCGLFSSATMFGMWDSMINTTIDRDLGHFQIHSKAFEDEKLLTDTIPNFENVISTIKTNKNVTGVSSRILIEGMASSATTSNGVRILGINTETEKKVTSVYKQIVKGSYFEENWKNQIVIGEKLADNLGIKEKSKIVLGFQGIDGSIIYGAFRVTGIFKTESSIFDKSNVFVKEDDILRLINSDKISNEIVVRLSSVQQVDSVYIPIKKEFSNLSVKYWGELAPELKFYYDMLICTNEHFCRNNFVCSFIWNNKYNADVCNGKSARVWCAYGSRNEKKSSLFYDNNGNYFTFIYRWNYWTNTRTDSYPILWKCGY